MASSGSKRVVVAMSGGVDSSVAAGLLVRQGYQVLGATLQLWPSDLPPGVESGCCSLSAVEDARRVAAHLGIPHYVLNFREHFERTVIADFTREYLAGRTPNPCVRCNQHVKFGPLLEKARSLGADLIATGHYARAQRDRTSGRWLLLRSVDEGKDQSYALHPLTQEQLGHTLFPLGGHWKVGTREMALELAPLVATKPDSQEICFVPNRDYGAFLSRRAPDALKPGEILNTRGELLGIHAGIANFTIGQRKRLGISSAQPLYVTEIDADENRVIVGGQGELMRKRVIATSFNLIGVDELEEPIRVSAKIRYNMRDVPALLSPAPGATLSEGCVSEVSLEFDEPQRAITPGQSLVCYLGDRVVGGGTIESAT